MLLIRQSRLLSVLVLLICFREPPGKPQVLVTLTHVISSGLGGGGFMTVRIPPSSAGKASDMYTIDFRETAPSLANTTMYVGKPESAKFGGLAVGVPGELRGLEEAHRRWGTLSWKRLIEPSIALAQGWKVDRELAKRITVGYLVPSIKSI